MNLAKLFEEQNKLDAHIIKEKRLEGHDLLQEKIAALVVELGELMNELPETFKYWSNKKNNYEKALVEYIDALHFFLSIGNDLKMHLEDIEIDSDYTEEDVTQTFNKLFGYISELLETSEVGARDDLIDIYEITFNLFVGLGEKYLNFTWDQIEQAYLEKIKLTMRGKKMDTKLYWYEMLQRGMSPGCQPAGFVDVDDSIGRWGIVSYDRELTQEEMDKYEMKPWEVVEE